MTNTTYYNLNIVEGTDIVNPLTVDNPNYEKIDETMHNNAVAGVTLATEIANATVHAITRENSDCAVIRFIATSRWKAGDTATVDGVPVTTLLPNGETLPDGAYIINANVLCILTGTNLTVYVGEKKVENASDIIYNDTNVKAELDALNGSVEQINGSIEQINSNLTEFCIGFPDYSNGVVVIDNAESGSWTADENCMILADNTAGTGYIIIVYNGTLSLSASNTPFFLKRGDTISIGYVYNGAKARVTKYPLR